MINQIVKFNVKPEYYEGFKAALIEDKKNAEQEAGYVEMRLFADKNQPNLIFCYERWKDQDALDYHREHPYTVKICRLVDTALQSPVEVLNLGETELAPEKGTKVISYDAAGVETLKEAHVQQESGRVIGKNVLDGFHS